MTHLRQNNFYNLRIGIMGASKHTSVISASFAYIFLAHFVTDSVISMAGNPNCPEAPNPDEAPKAPDSLCQWLW